LAACRTASLPGKPCPLEEFLGENHHQYAIVDARSDDHEDADEHRRVE
jgi:hypothetical protein